MASFQLKTVAAAAFSRSMAQNNIHHAYIGGFAVNLLGSPRPTDDIDVVMDVPANALRQRISEATANDSRFRFEGLKLIFQPDDNSPVAVFIETLPAGELGLPQSFSSIPIGEVLKPEVLVLTKTKRCVHGIASTRPRTAQKLHSDLQDIEHILTWLAAHGKKIDFAGYHAADPERLYTAVRQLLAYFESESNTALLGLMKQVLSEEDSRRITGTSM